MTAVCFKIENLLNEAKDLRDLVVVHDQFRRDLKTFSFA